MIEFFRKVALVTAVIYGVMAVVVLVARWLT